MLRLDHDVLDRVARLVPRAPVLLAPSCRTWYDVVHRRLTGPRGGHPPTARRRGGASWRYGACPSGRPGDDGIVYSRLGRPTVSVDAVKAVARGLLVEPLTVSRPFDMRLLAGLPAPRRRHVCIVNQNAWEWSKETTDGLAECQDLVVLELVHNHSPSYTGTVALLAVLPRLHALSVLALRINGATPAIAITAGAALSSMPSLRHLSLYMSQLESPVWLADMPLRTLSLEGNRRMRDTLVPPATLTRLSLRGCGVCRPARLSDLLVELDLSDNSKLVLPDLRRLSALRRLNLENCDLEAVDRLPARLEELGLAQNALARVPQLPRGIRVLDLSDNPIGYQSPRDPLPEALEELVMARTRVGVADAPTRALLDALPAGLRVLVLDGCPLGAWADFWTHWMPSAVVRLGRLEHLGLDAPSTRSLGALATAAGRGARVLLPEARRDEWERLGGAAPPTYDLPFPRDPTRDFFTRTVQTWTASSK
jgi:hypothetical protein